MTTHRTRLAITLAVAGTLLSVTAARAGTLTYTDSAVITGPFTGGFFQVCPSPIACEAPPRGTIAPTDLNPFVAPLNPVTVGITIGNDGGSIAVTAEIE